MERLSDSDKAAFAEGMRAASSQAEDTYKVVAVLRAIENDLPKNVSINGADIRKLVKDLEARGLIIPGRKVSDAEVRSLRGKVAAEMPRVSLRGIPFKGKQTPATYEPTDSLRLKAKAQEQQFEFLLMQEGDSREALDQRLEEQRDPLMRVANAMNPKRK